MMSGGGDCDDESATSGEEAVLVDRLDVLKQKLLDAAEEYWANSPAEAGRNNNDEALDKVIAERDSARRREAALLEEVTGVRSHLDACKRELAEAKRSTAEKTESLAAENAALQEKISKNEDIRTLAMGLLVFFFFYFEFDVLAWCLLAVLIYEKVVKEIILRNRRRRMVEEQKRDLEAGNGMRGFSLF